MDGLKDYQISVYVANLGKYVEGVLQGAWITLPMPAERLQDTLKTEVGLGGRYEEYAIHDYEGGEGLLATVANPGEYESLTDLNLMCRAFEAREDAGRPAPKVRSPSRPGPHPCPRSKDRGSRASAPASKAPADRRRRRVRQGRARQARSWTGWPAPLRSVEASLQAFGCLEDRDRPPHAGAGPPFIVTSRGTSRRRSTIRYPRRSAGRRQAHWHAPRRCRDRPAE